MTSTEQPPLLGGRYEVGERIGTGGMADVRRGVDVRLGRDVAIKVLRADLARDPSFLARFRREAQAAAGLNDPTIVSVYDTGEDSSAVPYIVMEHVDGRTLREVLQAEGRLLPTRALEVTADVCAALDVAHAAGIVHRDIKPGNVMLDRSGAVKVMDFGIARAAADSAMTQTSAVIGTAAYLSPEQARGEHVDARSDLYSTGCLLYELVTGTPPFVGESPVAVAYQHVREDPTPPSAYDETLPSQVDAVVLKAMAKNPENRYQSAQEMRADLLRARAGEPVLATPVLEPPPVLAPAAITTLRSPEVRNRKRGLAYGLFGAVLLAMVVGIAMLVQALLGTSAGLVPAPALVGLDQREAVVLLAQQGLRVGTVEERFDEKAFGTVLSQTPDQGIVVADGGSVDLVVSQGVEQTIVPAEIIGLARDEAEVLLRERKLQVQDVVTRDGLFVPGTVLGISPEPGRQVRANSGVTLTVASGNVEVPDVRGRSREEAVAALQRAGFSVGIQLRDDSGAPDRVLLQTPSNGFAQRGSTVTLVVSQVPAPPSPQPEPEPSPSPEPPTAAPSPPAPGPSPTG